MKELLEQESDEVKQKVEEYRKAKYEEYAPSEQVKTSIDTGEETGAVEASGGNSANEVAGSSRRLQLLARQKSVIARNFCNVY